MARYLTITEARQRLLHLPAETAADEEPIVVTRHGRPVLAILNLEQYQELESVLETAELLADEELMAGLRESMSQADHDQTLDVAAARERLGL
ncbi:MAG: type II toxin-antitoxin system Phd/YefM family antitoxin [Chloroflexota bacterium]|nr:type II toxin-antitoxin system Phd/YefM family antitoxin [Chloroflexota bacterium]